MNRMVYDAGRDGDLEGFCRGVIERSYLPAYGRAATDQLLAYHGGDNIARDARAGRVWCAREGGKLLGTATAAGGELSRMFVAPEARGRGLGRALAAEAAAWARLAGWPYLTAWAVPFARGFYEKLGFAMVNADVLNFEDRREPPVPHIEMRLRLDGLPAVRVEAAGPADAEEIVAGQRLAFEEQCRIYDDWRIPPVLESAGEVAAALGGGVALKAVCAGVVVGSVRGAAQGGVGHIGRLFVRPDHQGRGVARMLLAALEERLDGCDRFSLFTGERSEKNIVLYRRQGYAPTGRRAPAREVDPYDLVWLEKPNPWPQIEQCARRSRPV